MSEAPVVTRSNFKKVSFIADAFNILCRFILGTKKPAWLSRGLVLFRERARS
jgi:hypothetical protein